MNARHLAATSTPLVAALALLAGLSTLLAGCGGGGGGGARGAPNGNGVATIGPAGGDVGIVGGALDGTRLTVPAGALTTPTTFTIATGADITADTGFTPVGPGVKVTPDGQTFLTPATLTIPVSPALLPAGKTAADVRILKRDDLTGRLTLLSPSSSTATSATFLISSLSTFQSVAFVGGAPTITATSSTIGGTPPVVSTTGGETVTITGANLYRGSTVTWNGLQLAPADVTYVAGSGSLQARTPAGGVGTTVTVVVTQLPGGAVTRTDAFVYREVLVVTGQTPASNARLGPTETAFVTVSSDVDPTTLAAGTAAVYSRASIAATATGSIALASSRTIAFRPSAPLPPDGVLGVGLDGDLRSTAGVALAPVQTLSFTTAPATDLVTSALIQHSSSPAVTLRDGRVLVIGGKGPTPLAVAACYLYDPASGAVSAAGSLNTARLGHSAVLLADGKVGVIGGHSGASVVTTVEVYDPATNAWTTGPTTLGRTTQQSVVPISGGRWLAVGGYPSVNFVATTPAQQTPEVLNATFTSCTASVVTTLLAGPAVTLPNGDVALFGNRFASVGTAEGQVLTIGAAGLADANVVTTAPIFSGALAGGTASDPSAARVPADDRILVHRATFNNLVRVNYSGATPTGFTAQAGTPLPAARTRTATRLVVLGDGSILIGPGGFSVSVTNPVADLFVPGALGSAGTVIPLDLRTGRRSYSAVLLKDGRAGLFGGRSGPLSSGPEVQGLEVVSVEAAGQGSLSGMNLVALAASPATGFPIRPADTTVRFTLSGALDPATVIAANVTVTINATPASASVALQNRREVVVTLAPSATLAAGDALVVTLGSALRDTENRPLDTTRGAPSATYTVGP